MTYRLGIDVGNTFTTWAVIAGRPDDTPTTGTLNSVVTIVQTDDVHLVRDFVRRLGEPDPVIVGTTPYGAESLLARMISDILGTVRQREGEEPAAVVVVHDDGLDPYRAGLYAESARLAGVPAGVAFVVPRGEAIAAAPGVAAAVGAATVGWRKVPAPVDDDRRRDAAAVVLGTGASGAVIAAVAGDAIDGATAFSGAGGPLGSALGSAGPAGTPLGGVGPSGTALPAPGAVTGAPIAGPPAPLGTPLAPGATAPPPLSGPPAPPGTPTAASTTGDTPTTTLPVSEEPPVAPPPPRSGGGPLVDVSDTGPLVHTGWRRFWPVLTISLLVLIGLITSMAYMFGGRDAPSVAPVSTAARVVTTTTVRPVRSVAPATTAIAAAVVATVSTTTTPVTTTTTTIVATTLPPTTAPRTTVPRTTVRATIPPTAPATTVAVTAAVAATTPPTAPPTAPPTTVNVPPVIGSMSASKTPVSYGCAADPSTITVVISDASGVASASMSWTYQSSTAGVFVTGGAKLTGPSGGGAFSGTFTATNYPSISSSKVSVTVVAVDPQGLSSQITQAPIIVDYCIG